jgi:hypothetical protein
MPHRLGRLGIRVGTNSSPFSEIANQWPPIIATHDASATRQIPIAFHSVPPASLGLRGFLPCGLCDACPYSYRFPHVLTLGRHPTTLNMSGPWRDMEAAVPGEPWNTRSCHSN